MFFSFVVDGGIKGRDPPLPVSFFFAFFSRLTSPIPQTFPPFPIRAKFQKSQSVLKYVYRTLPIEVQPRTHKYLSRSFRLKRFWAGGTSIWNRRTLLCGSHTPKGFWGWFHRLLGEYYEDYELVVWTNVTRFPLVTYRRKQHHHQMERNGFNRIFRFMSDRKDAVRYIHTRVKNGGESYIRHPETLETPEKKDIRQQRNNWPTVTTHQSDFRIS